MNFIRIKNIINLGFTYIEPLFQGSQIITSFDLYKLEKQNILQKNRTMKNSQRKELNQKYVNQSCSQNKQGETSKKALNINDRFVLKSMIPIGIFYKTYKGIDLLSRKYVTIYIKPSSKEKMFSKSIKEELREKIAPPLKWSGTEKIDKNLFDIQVHARYGPSLDEIINIYKKKISEKTFYLLAYNALKLIDRIDNAGYVIRSISPKNIICGQSYLKNELFLINTFDLQRKNQESFTVVNFRYCSVGSHLKLKTCSKDTLQSLCYMLMDFYLRGNLFPPMSFETEKNFLQAKSTLKPEGIPVGFLEFFEYVRYLNFGQEIKFTEWKLKFKKYLSEEQLHRPYEWAQIKTKSDENSSKIGNLLLSALKNVSSLSEQNSKKKKKPEKQENLLYQQLELQQDKDEMQQGKLNHQFQTKMLETSSLFFFKY